jgi:hypothetical protein
MDTRRFRLHRLIRYLFLRLKWRAEKPGYSSATVEPGYKPRFYYVNCYKVYRQTEIYRQRKAAQRAKEKGEN